MAIKKNMGTIDRGIRISVALILGGLLFTGYFTGMWVWIMSILAVIFILTSVVQTCPLYLPLKISTRNKSK
ncbi:MAG: YgaP family membrane protein [Bacteroidia bacterium]|jgi:asparagine N-glycosylation enzyme membrane subunit Stt3